MPIGSSAPDIVSRIRDDLILLVVGIVLTAVLTGLLVPVVKKRIDKRSEHLRAAEDLLDTLAASPWAYWSLAQRVAYYGQQGRHGTESYELALKRWDDDKAWEISVTIQTQVSRSRRLLTLDAYKQLCKTQKEVCTEMADQVDELRLSATTQQWAALYGALIMVKREEIDRLLVDVEHGLQRKSGSGRTVRS